MRKLLLSLFLALALAFSANWVKADPTVGLDNSVGGAAISYWTCKDGFETLVNVQNVKDYAVAVHVVFFDEHSREILDFTVPLSAYDNWGAAVTCENGLIRITPVASFYQGPNNGSEVRHAPTNAVEGYITVAVTAVDGDCNRDGEPDNSNTCIANGDPRDEAQAFNYANTNVRLPNAIILRSAMVNYAAGNAFALNSVALLDFYNYDPQNPAVNPKSKELCKLLSNPADDVNGIKISTCELTDTENGEGFYVGAPCGYYWARYTENDIADTTLVMIFPAMGDNNALDLNIYDDNELHQSAYRNVIEVARLALMGPFDTEGDLAAFESGEIRIFVKEKTFIQVANLPIIKFHPAMFGFSLVEGPNFVDIYPIVREQLLFKGECYGNYCEEGGEEAGPAAPAGSEEGSCPGGMCL